MKKLLKKILIIIIVITLVFTNGGYIRSNVKVAKASSGTAEVVALELLLLLLLGLAGQKMEVNLPLPRNETDIKMLENGVFRKQSLWDRGVMDWDKIYNIDGVSLREYIIEQGHDWDNVNLDDWYTLHDYIYITENDVLDVVDVVEEFYDVPFLTSEKPNTVNGKLINVMNMLNKNNIYPSESAIRNTGVMEYKNIIVMYEATPSTYLSDKIYIIGSNENLKITNTRTSSFGMVKEYEYFVANENEAEEFEYNMVTLKFNQSSGYWSVSNVVNNGTRTLKTNYSDHIFDIEEHNRIIWSNFYLVGVVAKWMDNYGNRYKDYARSSDLSYRTFLESKYGVSKIGAGEEIAVNVEAWARALEEIPDYAIDDFGSTDAILENIKEIDEFSREKFGEEVISKQIVDVREYIDEIDITKYQAVVAVQGDIQTDFKNTYANVVPTDVDIPENILNGLMFVAFVFGEMWAHLGSYSFVLVFSATIGAIAILIGLGKQVNDRGSMSSKPSKKSKKGG